MQAMSWTMNAPSVPAGRQGVWSSRLRSPTEAVPFWRILASGVMVMFDTISRPLDPEENLRDGVVDVAIDWLPVQLDPFVNKKLFDDRLVLLARREHPSVGVGLTTEELLKAEFVNIHHRREIEHAPIALSEFLKLGIRETVYVSEPLEIPALVASTDLLGVFPASMGPLMEQRLGLYETRRHDPAHRWLREAVAQELSRVAPG
jgi:DNA-binding transcriptional LysR family regulator